MEITRNQITIKTAPTPVAYSQINGGPTAAHFFPGSGFTFGCYRQMWAQLSPTLSLTGMDPRPTWPGIGPPPADHSWDIYLDDLIAFLDSLNASPVIGIGHSLGAITTIRAAARRPDLFSALILLEPALYPASWIRIGSMVPWRYKPLHPQVSGALSRQDTWESRQAAFDILKEKKVFSRLSPEAMRDYVDYALSKNDDGHCRLKFRKDWEARIYAEPPMFWDDFQRVTHPVLGIKGKNTIWFLSRQWKKWKKMRPADTHHYIDGTHLLPLERPNETAAIINDWLKRVL